MDERDYDIAMVEVIAANDALEQEWRMSLAGRRGKDANSGQSGYSGAEDIAIDNEGAEGQPPPVPV